MQEIIKKNNCTGCTACMNICPVNAITMELDNEGFKYPVINQDKCINCGLCKKTCPVLNTNSNCSLNKCYVGYTKEDLYKKDSSSGGIFPLIASYILKESGIVIGAAFDSNQKLKHIAVTKDKDLNKIKGSKYLQSDLDIILKFIKENIKDKKILFVGVPCQVAGLKSFLKKDYDNLYTIDLVCHGVPSPKLFDKYIKEIEKNENDKLIKYNFRDKSTGWDTYSNTMKFKNKEKSELNNDNLYMKLFLSDIALRESCYNCNFKLGNKYSDITLGDFWGVQNYYPEMYSKKGVSAIIINSEKGNKLFNLIKNELNYKLCKIEEITSGNPSLVKSSIRPNKRDEFFKNLENDTINILTNKYKKKNSFIKRVINKVKRILFFK